MYPGWEGCHFGMVLLAFVQMCSGLPGGCTYRPVVVPGSQSRPVLFPIRRRIGPQAGAWPDMIAVPRNETNRWLFDT